MSSEKEVLATIQEIYRDLTGSTRDLRPDDRLAQDLAIDSLRAMELLFDLEERYDLQLVDDPRNQSVRQVGDVVTLVLAVAGEQRA